MVRSKVNPTGFVKKVEFGAWLSLVFALTLIGFSSFGTRVNGSAGSPQWTQRAGAGIATPACSSANVGITCSGNQPLVTFTWTGGSGPQDVLYINYPSVIWQGSPVNGTLTVPPGVLANNTSYTYRNQDWFSVYNDNTPFTTPNCACAANAGSSCTSAPNACGQTRSNGTIQCDGSCSSTPPANANCPLNACAPNPAPAGYGSSCTSAPNACGQTTSGTIQCNGSCSATTPSNAGCAPTALLSANPSTIDSGQSSDLFWSSTNATSCASAGGFSTGGATSNPPGGVSTGALTQTSTYQITCSGPGGTSAPSSATVTVLNPSASITPSPNRVNTGGGGGGGGTTTVSWNATDVNACTITRNGATWRTLTANSSGVVSGSSTDTVTTQTTYVISCTNSAGGSAAVATATAVVNVVSGFQEF